MTKFVALEVLIALVVTACVRTQPRLLARPRGADARLEAAAGISVHCDPVAHFPSSDPTAVVPPIEAGMPIRRAGSGVVVGPRHVLTALHVVGCPLIPTVRVRTYWGEDRAVRVTWEDRDRDLALLELVSASDFEVDVAPPVISAPLGDVIILVTAYPREYVRQGAVCATNLDRRAFDGADLCVSADATPGNSGSGVYDGLGRLIGIVLSRVQDRRALVSTLAGTGIEAQWR
jgi:S1-C subfamily serine protease